MRIIILTTLVLIDLTTAASAQWCPPGHPNCWNGLRQQEQNNLMIRQMEQQNRQFNEQQEQQRRMFYEQQQWNRR